MHKLIWISIAGMLMAHPVQAQQASTTPQPLTKVDGLKLEVTLPEAEVIWQALRKLPVEQVEQLMAKIRQQVSEQQNKPVENKEVK